MGIIDDYFNDAEITPTPAIKSKGIVEQYLKPEEKVTVKTQNTDPKVPISGISKESSDELNATRAENKGGDNPRAGIINIPVRAAGAIWDAAKHGLSEASQGLGETFTGKPASGVGKVGMGLLSTLTSPLEGANSVVKDITGNKQAGNIAGLALPLIPGSAAVKLISKNLPKNKALSELVDKITSGGRDNQALVDTVNAMKADSRIGPADTSPAVLNMTQKLFTTEGDAAKNYLHSTSASRVANLGEDVTKAFDAAGGIPVNALNKINELSNAAKKTGNDIINPALKAAGPVNVSKTIDEIDNVLKPGVWSKFTAESSLPLSSVKDELSQVRKYLANKKEMRTDAQDLHEFQSSIRRTAEGLLRSQNGGERQLGDALMKVRNNLVDDINAASPKINVNGKDVGQYKHGLASYREDMHIKESFYDGYNGVFSNSTKMENRPEFTKKWFDDLTDHEKEAAREGARLAIDSRMGVAGNPSLAGTNVGKSDFNQQKLEILFGKNETEKLLRNLENTRAIKNTHNKVIEGSQTEMRRAGDEAIALPVKPDTNPLNKYITPAAAAGAEMFLGQGTGLGAAAVGALAVGAKGLSAASHAAKTALAKERNLQMAKMSLPVEGPSRDQLIKQLEAHIPGPKQSLMTRGVNNLSRLVSP